MSRKSVMSRLTAKLRFDASGCWIFTGCLLKGYGQINSGGNGGKALYAHRVTYEAFIGPIPPNKNLDHLCRTPACVNPWHLEPVTQRENIMRGMSEVARRAERTHCPQGHAYDCLNFDADGRAHRNCRTCRNAYRRRRYAEGKL